MQVRAAAAAVVALALSCALPMSAGATEGMTHEGDHHHTHTVTPPPPSDPRFMPGTTGPVVTKGAAVTVVIPDGPGFGGEKGRVQDNGDLAKNNYSVTDPNFNNYLGLLPRHPDTGQPMTYVQHIQTYAAAGFLETFAPDVYAGMVAHQNAGEGTVLGAAAYVMGLVKTPDPAAHCSEMGVIPERLPGSPILARNYVRSTRDGTRQDWARMHHAQTAPMVYRMLVESGLPWSTALILAGDDGISGSGRLNGVNNQSGTMNSLNNAAATGFNNDEKAVYHLAAEMQRDLANPHIVHHMMMGHNHDGLHSTALTRPRINSLLGMVADDRSTTFERATKISDALAGGTLGVADAASAEKFTLQNEFLLRNDTDVDLDMNWPTYMNRVGDTVVFEGNVHNHGPHIGEAAELRLELPPQLELVSMTVGDKPCASPCALGDIGYTDRILYRIEARLVAYGKAGVRLGVTMRTAERLPEDNSQTREIAISTPSTVSARQLTATGALRSCGSAASPCRQLYNTRHFMGGVLTPATDGGNRWVAAKYYRYSSGRWSHRFDRWVQVSATGAYRTETWRSALGRGRWRVQVVADDTWLTGEARSGLQYVTVV